MESKYKKRAETISQHLKVTQHDELYDNIIETMCQLAEEVENINVINKEETLIYLNNVLQILKEQFPKQDNICEYKTVQDIISRLNSKELYTKQQVEELLQKQRELCAEKVELIDKGYSDELPNGDMYYFEKLIVDEYSILNAKLKLE